MQADSSVINKKTAGSPAELMNSVAALTSGLRAKSAAEARESVPPSVAIRPKPSRELQRRVSTAEGSPYGRVGFRAGR
jgi:hypothetical protein